MQDLSILHSSKLVVSNRGGPQEQAIHWHPGTPHSESVPSGPSGPSRPARPSLPLLRNERASLALHLQQSGDLGTFATIPHRTAPFTSVTEVAMLGPIPTQTETQEPAAKRPRTRF